MKSKKEKISRVFTAALLIALASAALFTLVGQNVSKARHWGEAFDTQSIGSLKAAVEETSAHKEPAPTAVDFQLTVSLTGGGKGRVIVAGIANCFSGSCTYNFPANKPIDLGAFTEEAKFTGWQASGPAAGCAGKTGQCSFILTESTTVTAKFDPGILLTLSPLGEPVGRILSQSELIRCPPDCENQFTPGSTVTLTPNSPNAVFAGWLQGTGSASACTGSTPCTFTITQPSTLKFMFSAVRFKVLTAPTGTGAGTLTYSTGGVPCPNVCERDFLLGSQISVEAKAAASSRFTKWTQGPCKDQTTTQCAFTVDRDISVEAEFSLLPKVTLSLTLIGNDDGAVSSFPPGIACGEKEYPVNKCSASYDVGNTVTLTASGVGLPQSEYKGWFQGTGAAVSCTGKTSSTCTITMTENSSLKAKFCRRVAGCLGN